MANNFSSKFLDVFELVNVGLLMGIPDTTTVVQLGKNCGSVDLLTGVSLLRATGRSYDLRWLIRRPCWLRLNRGRFGNHSDWRCC